MYLEKQFLHLTQLGFRQDGLPQLKQYIDLLWKTNESLNLVSRKMTFEELIDNHIIDCLLPLKHFPIDCKTIADLGSGGGLPGVIYAIQFPHLNFHLFEKSILKQEFLHMCKAIAPNLHIHGEIPKSISNIDLVVSRGFKPLEVTLEMTHLYLNSGGRYFLLKARRTKIDEEISVAEKKFKKLNVVIQPLHSPVLDVERHVLLINEKTLG